MVNGKLCGIKLTSSDIYIVIYAVSQLKAYYLKGNMLFLWSEIMLSSCCSGQSPMVKHVKLNIFSIGRGK